MVNDAMMVCSEDAKVNRVTMEHKLPANLTGITVQIDSKRATCQDQYVNLLSNNGGFFLGTVWFIEDTEGTIEKRITDLAWNALHMQFKPVVAKERTADGMLPVTLNQVTEFGTVPLEGEITPDGKILLLGHFHRLNGDVRADRLASMKPFIDASPAHGSATAPLTLVEFSDFECPSCQHSAGYLDSVLAPFGDKVRYVRYDVPLLSMHPWAMAAAIAGRAIARQNPTIFWEYKKQIYSNQDKLTAFTIDQFARGFAEDHSLDMKRYDADVNSEEIRKLLLNGVGAAFTNDVRSTPTYLVNGVFVDPGPDGQGLTKYLTGALANK